MNTTENERNNLTDQNITVHFHERNHMHKFLFELLNVSHMALLGLTHAWFTNSDAEERCYSVYHKMEILSYGHYHIIYGLYI